MNSLPEILGHTPWLPGKIIGGIYEIRGVLGRGGFGLVYQAHDQATHKDIAIKVPLGREECDAQGRPHVVRFVENPAAKTSLHEEVRAWMRLAHPHVVRAFDIQDDETTDYLPAICMDLCDGGSLDRRIHGEAAGQHPLPLAEGLDLAIQVCWGMEYVHGQGLVHRDLKPANVLLARADGGTRALVSDLGLAKALGARGAGAEALAADGEAVAAWWVTVSQAGGTPAYMAPEQWESGAHVGPTSDVYAFGILLYELFCGRLPYEGGSSWGAWRRAHREAAVPAPRAWRGELPETLTALMVACLAKAPASRPDGFGKIGRALASVYGEVTGREYGAVRVKPGAVELSAEAKKGQASAKVRLGLGAYRRGDLTAAEREWKEAGEILQSLGDRAGLSTCLCLRAFILQDWGRLEEAMAVYKGTETIFRVFRCFQWREGDRERLS